VARLITLAENEPAESGGAAQAALLAEHRSAPADHHAPVIGLTGTGGAGKSSLLDELMLRVLRDNPALKVALLCVDPTRKRTGGALLGDRIRMNALGNAAPGQLFMRSLASRGSKREVCEKLGEAVQVCQASGFDLIFVETSGIGQGDDAITEFVDHSLYVMTPEFGAETQLEKIEMLDVADFVVLNKFERRGALDALAAVRKQVRRNRGLFAESDDELPVLATIASQFADPSIDELWKRLAARCELGSGSPAAGGGEGQGGGQGGGLNRPHASEPLLPANDTDVVNGLASSYRVIIPTDRCVGCPLLPAPVLACLLTDSFFFCRFSSTDSLARSLAHFLLLLLLFYSFTTHTTT
jgi:methylmalonyl-CoA mutase